MPSEVLKPMELCGLWAVHSSSQDRPVLRGWTRSKADAEALVEQLKKKDEVKEDRYWVEPMTKHDFTVYRSTGIIPQDMKI